MIDRLKAFFAAVWVFFAGMTVAQLNVYLGTVSLSLGISYQLWKWRREARTSTPQK